jgi:hypothetical protein
MTDEYALAYSIMQICGVDMSDSSASSTEGIKRAIVAQLRLNAPSLTATGTEEKKMNIVDYGLVREYFGCEVNKCKSLNSVEHDWLSCMAYRILKSMQEPIRKTDWYLCVTEHDGDITVEEAHGNISLFNRWHPACLRRPDRFQPTEKECDCGGCNGGCGKCHSQCECPKPSLPKEVEEKIDSILIANHFEMMTFRRIRDELRELCEIVRSTKA